MKFRRLVFRSLRYRWRTHLGVVLGAAVGSAALTGALVVGDSVRETLRQQALQRLAGAELAMDTKDRFFERSLAERIRRIAGSVSSSSLNPRTNTMFLARGTNVVRIRTNVVAASAPTPIGVLRPKYGDTTALLHLPAVASRQDGTARANHVQVWGVHDFWLFARPDEFENDRGRLEEWRQKTDLPPNSVLLNETLAAQLGVKPLDVIILRMHKPSALSRDAVITPRDDTSFAFRLTVAGIISAEDFGNLNLESSQSPPANAFVRIDELAPAAGVKDRANVLLAVPMRKTVAPSAVDWLKIQANRMLTRISPRLMFKRRLNLETVNGPEQAAIMNRALAAAFLPGDFEVALPFLDRPGVVELNSKRIFLDDALVRAATTRPAGLVASLSSSETRYLPLVTNGTGILTYLANLIQAGDRATPYSMITAAGAPYTAAYMRDDEIIVNDWLARDLQLKEGDTVGVSYYLADTGSQLVERTNEFRVRAVVPLEGVYADRTLMPEFPGLAKAESTHDWDAGFPLVHKIRDHDEAYWKQYRGTPKAFVTLAAGQKMWANRFGSLTAVRWSIPEDAPPMQVRGTIYQNLRSNLNPMSLGFHFEPVRQQALASANNAQDFGQLFLGFSFFLIIAAIILMALLFQFGLEERTEETGILLALGFTPRRVRRLFLLEGTALSAVGGTLGVFAGIEFGRLMLFGLATLWRQAIGATRLEFFVTSQSLLIGLFASTTICVITIAVMLRKQARRPAHELLTTGTAVEWDQAPRSQRAILVGALGVTLGLGLVGWAVLQGETASPQIFFGAGSALLLAGLAFASGFLRALAKSERARRLSLTGMGVRSSTRRRKRSLATVSLLAAGTFMVIAVSANRLDANWRPERRSSGTGGFALIGESALPIVHDLNSQRGQEFFGLSPQALQGASFVQMRVRGGDEASCLNLNRAQQPTLLGVSPEALANRNAFSFAKGAPKRGSPWLLLKQNLGSDVIPAIGDQNSIQWAMKKKVGDTLDYFDEKGRFFQVKIVASVANSILQGKLLIDEAEFVKRFPNESGYRMFLIDAPSNAVAEVSASLSRAMQDAGLELTPAARRLAAYNAVQNTYLNTFQILGGLGLLLGSIGLGIVVLRNVLERRAELAVLQAVGFRKRALHWLVASENSALLILGLCIGIVAAAIAVWPVLRVPNSGLPWMTLALTLGGVLVFGFASAFIASWIAVKGNLLAALRNE